MSIISHSTVSPCGECHREIELYASQHPEIKRDGIEGAQSLFYLQRSTVENLEGCDEATAAQALLAMFNEDDRKSREMFGHSKGDDTGDARVAILRVKREVPKGNRDSSIPKGDRQGSTSEAGTRMMEALQELSELEGSENDRRNRQASNFSNGASKRSGRGVSLKTRPAEFSRQARLLYRYQSDRTEESCPDTEDEGTEDTVSECEDDEDSFRPIRGGREVTVSAENKAGDAIENEEVAPIDPGSKGKEAVNNSHTTPSPTPRFPSLIRFSPHEKFMIYLDQNLGLSCIRQQASKEYFARFEKRCLEAGVYLNLWQKEKEMRDIINKINGNSPESKPKKQEKTKTSPRTAASASQTKRRDSVNPIKPATPEPLQYLTAIPRTSNGKEQDPTNFAFYPNDGGATPAVPCRLQGSPLISKQDSQQTQEPIRKGEVPLKKLSTQAGIRRSSRRNGGPAERVPGETWEQTMAKAAEMGKEIAHDAESYIEVIIGTNLEANKAVNTDVSAEAIARKTIKEDEKEQNHASLGMSASTSHMTASYAQERHTPAAVPSSTREEQDYTSLIMSSTTSSMPTSIAQESHSTTMLASSTMTRKEKRLTTITSNPDHPAAEDQNSMQEETLTSAGDPSPINLPIPNVAGGKRKRSSSISPKPSPSPVKPRKKSKLCENVVLSASQET